MIKTLPAQYAKFIAALVTVFVGYVQAYGFVWHPVAAFTLLAGAFGVMGIPNAPKSPTAYVGLPPKPPLGPNPPQLPPGIPPR